MRSTLSFVAVVQFGLLLSSAANAQGKPHVVLLSIDGMRPDYVTHAAEHCLNLPTLRRFMAEGTYSDGVVGVFPTMTYPSHTTLITGVWPAEHGIYNNAQFRPMDEPSKSSKETYHDARDVKVASLWQAAKKADLTTASVSWPVTGESPYIDWNLGGDAEEPGGGERMKILGASASGGNGDQDARRTDWACELIRKYQPNFITIHLGLTDEAQHAHGPFSSEADKALEAIDGELARIMQAELAVDPRATIVVVSDHGFVAVDHKLNLSALFAENGLIKIDARDSADRHPKILSWDAAVWESGGSAAIVLRNPNDKALYVKTYEVLKKAEADPSLGIKRVLTRDQFVPKGGNPQASFFVDLQAGFKIGPNIGGAVLQSTPGMGTHGYLPDEEPQVRSAFFVMGPGVRAHKDLGVIDMRQIAPTVARLLGVTLSAAKQPPLSIQK